MRRGAFTVAASLALTLASAGAARASEPELRFDGSAWVSVDLEAPAGAAARFEMRSTTQDASLRGVGLWLRDPSGATSRLLWTSTGGGSGALLRLPAAGVDLDAIVVPAGPATLALTVEMRDLAAGRYRLVAVMASDGAPGAGSATWSGAGAISVTSGGEVYAVPGASFPSAATVSASAAGAGTTVVHAGVLEREIAGEHYGWFASAGPGSTLRFSGPGIGGDGSASFSGTSPGTYRFEVSGAGRAFAWGAGIPSA